MISFPSIIKCRNLRFPQLILVQLYIQKMYNLTFNTPYDQHIKKRVMNAHLRQHHQTRFVNPYPEPMHFNTIRLGDGKVIDKLPKRNK